MRSALAIIAAVLMCSFPLIVFAETKEIVTEGTYNMGDGETPSVAESRALLKAKQIALEQAGTYVESYSKVKDIILTQDEIQVLASGLMEVDIIDKKRTVVGDGINFWVKIKAKISPDNMEEMAKRVREKTVLEEYKKIQEYYAKSQKEIERLKRELIQTNDAKKKKKMTEIAQDERMFQASELFEKGQHYDLRKEYDNAIDAYTEIITIVNSLNSVDAIAKKYASYVSRGNDFARIKQYKRAIDDFTQAIAISPGYHLAYWNRGFLHASLNMDDEAIEDYNKAIKIEPAYAPSYFQRGKSYMGKNQYDKAISDFSQALKIDTNYTAAYFYRGLCYDEKNEQERAYSDYKRVIALNPYHADAYYSIGVIYGKEGQVEQALANIEKAINFDPNVSYYYVDRGVAYYKIGSVKKAMSDFKKACDMGDMRGCKILKDTSR